MASKILITLFCILLVSSLIECRSVERVKRQSITDFISKAFSALKSFSDAVGKHGYDLKGFATVADALSPALGAIGPLFSLATSLIPKGPSAELKALEAGFKTVNIRFDNVDKKLDEILLNIEKAVVYESYKENEDKLQRVALKVDQFSRVPGEAAAHQELQEICAKNDPDITLDWIYRNCVQDQMGAELLVTIFKDAKYDRKLLLQFFEIILNDFVGSAFMRQICLAVRFPNATDIMEDNKKQDEQKLQAIHTKLMQFEKMLKENFYPTQIVADMSSQLELHQGENHTDFAQIMKQYLDTKYYWLIWGAHVYDAIEGFQNHAVQCEQTDRFGCQFLWRKFQRNLVVDWRDQDTSNATSAIQRYEARKDDVSCEKNHTFWSKDKNAEELNNALWSSDGLEGRNMVLVVKENAKLASAHGDHEIQIKHCKKYDVIISF